MNLTTSRLTLIPLTLTQLELAVDHVPKLEQALGLPLEPEIINGVVHRAVEMKIEKMKRLNERLHDIQTYWLMALQESPKGIGMIGFKGPPNDAGEIEIGYGIAPVYRKAGYTTEAVSAMLEWGFAQPHVEGITALNVLKENIPSIKILERYGFQLRAEHEHGLDFVLPKSEFL